MTTYRGPYDSRVALDPVLVASAEECEAAHSCGGKELNSKDGVDLADELVADIDSSLSHGAAKLHVMSATSIYRASDASIPTLKSSGRLSSLSRGAPKRPCVSSREAEPSA